MTIDKSLQSGSLSMLVLKLTAEEDRYGYQMIEALRERSDHTFDLKAGTLYPLLRGLEEKGWVVSYQQEAENGRMRKYYSITVEGRKELDAKAAEWKAFSGAVEKVMNGAVSYGLG